MSRQKARTGTVGPSLKHSNRRSSRRIGRNHDNLSSSEFAEDDQIQSNSVSDLADVSNSVRRDGNKKEQTPEVNGHHGQGPVTKSRVVPHTTAGTNKIGAANSKGSGRQAGSRIDGIARNSNAASPESSAGILASLSGASASSFPNAIRGAKSATLGVHTREKAELTTSFPEIQQPTGLPVRQRRPPNTNTVNLPKGDPNAVGTVSGANQTTRNPETDTQVAAGPLPASQVTTSVSAPPSRVNGGEEEDEGTSWWDWLTGKLDTFLNSIPISDPALSTSAGPRQQVDLSGAADPSQNAEMHTAANSEVVNIKAGADAATSQYFGENDVYPTLAPELMQSSYQISAPSAPQGATLKEPPSLPPEIQAQFDQSQESWIRTRVDEQTAKYQQEQLQYQERSEQARQEGLQEIERENTKASTRQQSAQQQALVDVEAQRRSWRQENQRIQTEFDQKSSDERQRIDGEIQKKVETTDKTAEEKLRDAESKAETERIKTEQEAQKKKEEYDNKPRGFWEGIKDSISSVFSTIKNAVNSLFDGLRKLVKSIIDEAKRAVHDLIDLARNAITGLIKGFGEALKGFVTIALSAFPDAAAAAGAWIDSKVNSAVETVDAIAEDLKAAADVILDGIGAVLDTFLSALQASFNALLDVLEFLAKAPFELMELLEKVVDFIGEFGQFLDGIKELYDNPKMIEDAAKATVQGMINQVPDAVKGVVDGIGSLGHSAAEHTSGIWRHLQPKLNHLRQNWWATIKDMLWNLVWPFNQGSPLWKDAPRLAQLPGIILQEIWGGQFSDATDKFLELGQKINSVVGIFYGWFFIASVLVGAIIGAFFGGAGAIPGALAGAAIAGEAGEALLAGVIGVESGIIAKAAIDLSTGSGSTREKESAYERISASSLTLGITGVMMILGEIANELAQAVIEGAKGFFRGEAPEAPVNVEAPTAEAPTAEAPTAEAPTAEAPTAEAPTAEAPTAEAPEPFENVEAEAPESTLEEPVLAEEPTPDGEHIRVTEDEVFICSECELLDVKYDEELSANPNIAEDLREARSISDPTERAQAMAEIRERLESIRSEDMPEIIDESDVLSQNDMNEFEPSRREMKNQESLTEEQSSAAEDPSNIDWDRYRTDRNYKARIDEDYGIPSGETPGTAKATPADILGDALERSGEPRPPGHEPHHIVAAKDVRAEPAREILEEAGIDINDPENGVWSPRTSGGSATEEGIISDAFTSHDEIHTDRYWEEINNTFQEVGPEGAADALERIKIAIRNGTFPR